MASMIDIKADLLRLIGSIEKDMEEHPDPRLAQIAALKAALAAVDGSRDVVPTPSYFNNRSGSHRTGKKKDLFKSLVGELLERHAGLVHRTEILRHLRARNFFSGHEFNHERAMSKYLSLEPAFAPAGDGNWKFRGPVEAPNEIKPQEVSPAT